MRIDFYRPGAQLQPFIRYYWILNTNDDIDTLTFPIGCPQLIFHRLSQFYIPELEAVQARFSISGQVNFPARIQSSGDVETIVVVFHPHAIGTMFNFRHKVASTCSHKIKWTTKYITPIAKSQSLDIKIP